jgi:hypothetical protein
MGTNELVDTSPFTVLMKPVSGWAALFACVSLSKLLISGMNPNQVVLNDVLELCKAPSPAKPIF